MHQMEGRRLGPNEFIGGHWVASRRSMAPLQNSMRYTIG